MAGAGALDLVEIEAGGVSYQRRTGSRTATHRVGVAPFPFRGGHGRRSWWRRPAGRGRGGGGRGRLGGVVGGA